MGIYEAKMYLKRLAVVKFILKRKVNKEDSVKRISLQNDGLNIIKKVEVALEDFDVQYFADYGTLLGIIRDHTFISWDNDIDYGLLIDECFDWELFEKHLNNYGFVKKREFEIDKLVKEQTYSNINLGLTVDFFSHRNFKDKSTTYDFFRKENYIYHNEHEFHVRKAECIYIDKAKTVEFLGTTVHVPRNAEEYLENIYGKNWRIPDPNWSEGEDNPDSLFREIKKIGKGTFY